MYGKFELYSFPATRESARSLDPHVADGQRCVSGRGTGHGCDVATSGLLLPTSHLHILMGCVGPQG